MGKITLAVRINSVSVFGLSWDLLTEKMEDINRLIL